MTIYRIRIDFNGIYMTLWHAIEYTWSIPRGIVNNFSLSISSVYIFKGAVF